MSPVRYRFRAYPTPDQVRGLTRTFGCARVVYNDCLRLRQDAHAAGEKLSDTEVQRRVITLAKATPEREWLGEVASVALVHACRDARRAYRNWFDSLSGKRVGRRVGAPCTVIREADGRYSVSFVVERHEQPLPPTSAEVGVDLGLDRLAVTSDGKVVDNPRHLRRKARALARAQRALARKQRGSANRRKAVRRVAVLYRRVRETRLDHHHKLALRLVVAVVLGVWA